MDRPTAAPDTSKRRVIPRRERKHFNSSEYFWTYLKPHMDQLDFYHLFGKERKDRSFMFLASLGQFTTVSENSCKYHNFAPKGISFCFTASGLEYIHFYSGDEAPFSHFGGKLPHDLTWEMRSTDVITKLQQPDKTLINVSIQERETSSSNMLVFEYYSLGLRVTFTNPLKPISSICIYKPKHEEFGCDD